MLVVAVAFAIFGTDAQVSASAATPRVVVSEACDVAPRGLEEIDDLLARTDIATPAATTAGQTVPEGVPADDATAARIEEIVGQWLTCQNAGEPLRAWALFSDGYLYRLLSRQGGLSAEAYAAMATPAVADGGAVILEIRDARILPDGRYGATVTIAYPSVPMPKTFFFFVAEERGRLVIDGILGEISFSVP